MNVRSTVLCLVGLSWLPFSLCAKTWGEVLAEKITLCGDDSWQIVQRQYAAYTEKSAPSIAASVIKSIIIRDGKELLIDVKTMSNERVMMLPDTPNGKPYVGPQYNSGLPNASKMRLGVWSRLVKVPLYLDELAPFFGYRPGSIVIKIFEGLRDLKVQEQLFKVKVKEIKDKDPLLSDEAAEVEASRWVSPVKNNIPVHATGAAVDIRLWSLDTHDFVDLGAFGVIWGASEGAPTFSEHITDVQKLNRVYLLLAMAKAGLVNYPYEYWHFSFGDRYAVYWTVQQEIDRCACYGAIDNA